jgi:hypothetical protein
MELIETYTALKNYRVKVFFNPDDKTLSAEIKSQYSAPLKINDTVNGCTSMKQLKAKVRKRIEFGTSGNTTYEGTFYVVRDDFSSGYFKFVFQPKDTLMYRSMSMNVASGSVYRTDLARSLKELAIPTMSGFWIETKDTLPTGTIMSAIEVTSEEEFNQAIALAEQYYKNVTQIWDINQDELRRRITEIQHIHNQQFTLDLLTLDFPISMEVRLESDC